MLKQKAMSLEFIGHTLTTIGTIMISYTVLAVHYRVRKEHKIDDVVFKHMRREQSVGFIGIAMIVFGYIFQASSVL